MNLAQLYYFRKLSELQHYTKAAKELYITQPALSDAIHSLEKELGVPLFQKEGRNVKLTCYGREFSAYVRDALCELDKGIEMMRKHTGGLSGNIFVGGLFTVTGDYLPALIRAYRDNCGDGVKIEVSQNFSLALTEGLKNDTYDVIFAARKENEPKLHFEPLFAHQLVVVVPKGSRLASRPFVSLGDLRSYDIHTYRPGTPIGDEVDRVLVKYGISAHQDFDDEITMGGMLSMADPHECALLTYTLGLKPFMDRIDIVAIDAREVPRDFHYIYMVYKKEKFQSGALESFIDFALKFPVPEEAVLRCS